MKTPYALLQVFDDPKKGLYGNTSSVVMMEQALSDIEMQKIAANFNQPATTFLWPAEEENHYYVRWFAPDSEIGLCGHGSLAAAAYLKHKHSFLHYRQGVVEGNYTEEGNCSIALDVIENYGLSEPPKVLEPGLGIAVKEYYTTNNKQIVVVESEEALKYMRPNFSLLRESEIFGYTVTAKGEEADFVSRTIVPHVKQLEDPATGSSHAAIAPFWSKRLNKTKMTAYQLSQRGGRFDCEINDKKVKLTGNFSLLAEGELYFS